MSMSMTARSLLLSAGEQIAVDEAMIEAQVRGAITVLLIAFGVVFFAVLGIWIWFAFRMMARTGRIGWVIAFLIGIGALALSVGALINVPFPNSGGG